MTDSQSFLTQEWTCFLLKDSLIPVLWWGSTQCLGFLEFGGTTACIKIKQISLIHPPPDIIPCASTRWPQSHGSTNWFQRRDITWMGQELPNSTTEVREKLVSSDEEFHSHFIHEYYDSWLIESVYQSLFHICWRYLVRPSYLYSVSHNLASLDE